MQKLTVCVLILLVGNIRGQTTTISTISTSDLPTSTTPAASTTSSVAPTTSTVATTTSSLPPTSSTPSTSTIPSTTNSVSSSTLSPNSCASSGVFCQDCRTLKVCLQSGAAPIQTISCRTQNLFAPYCDTSSNQCVSSDTCTITTTSASPTPGPSSIKCSRQERRPNPLDCTQYIECVPGSTANTYVGYSVTCPFGQRYNARFQRCGILAPCNSVRSSCFLRSGTLVQYADYPSLYVYCPRRGSSEQYLVFQCRGDYIFDQSSSQCKPRCTRVGNIARNENCKQFYSCSRTLFSFRMTLNSCPSGMGFNTLTKQCDTTQANCVSVS